MTVYPDDSLSPKPSKTILITGIVLAVFIPFVLSTLVHLTHWTDLNLMTISRFIFWVTAALLYVYARYAERQPLLLWDEHYNLEFYVKWIARLYLLSIAAGLISAIPLLFHIKDNQAVLQRWVNVIVGHYWLLLFCSITAGVTEEIILRGYIQTRLQQLFKNTYMPVIISAAIFSALHYSYFSLRETIFTFLIGVIMAVHYQKYRNIHVLIAVHFMIDFLSFLLARYVTTHHVKVMIDLM